MMIKKYIIKEQECGYLMKDGRFVELLTAGRYSYLNISPVLRPSYLSSHLPC